MIISIVIYHTSHCYRDRLP